MILCINIVKRIYWGINSWVTKAKTFDKKKKNFYLLNKTAWSQISKDITRKKKHGKVQSK